MEKKELILATKNKHKIKELSSILAPVTSKWKIITLEDIDFHDDIEENGLTFKENALIKARTISKKYNRLTVADDSGLEVDYLNGLPGIKSARFVSPDATFKERNDRILELLSEVPVEKRSARFICVAALLWPDGREETFKGVCEGRIAFEAKGTEGFGYDPIFHIPSRGKSMAEVLPEEKNKISHRALAFKKLVFFLDSIR
jgi:XTP/dITP diphosphohydrolase